MRLDTSYGIDAPGMVRAHFLLAIVLAITALACYLWPEPSTVTLRAACGAAIAVAILLFGACVMLYSSLVGKQRVCDRLVAALELSGNEDVLDAGCGLGLALVRCARDLTSGTAVGIDLWSAKDLSNNTPEVTLANATRAGVADRVTVETGDVRRLPFSDASFDAVISMTVIHNIPSRDGRDQALHELVRVLKPGGRMAIFDLLYVGRLRTVLRQAGMQVEDLGTDFLWFCRGRSLLVRKPSID